MAPASQNPPRLFESNAVDEAEFYLKEYQEHFVENADWPRLQLAHILLLERRKPSAARKPLKQVRLPRLTMEQQKRAKNVATAPGRLLRSGIEDTEDELDWH